MNRSDIQKIIREEIDKIISEGSVWVDLVGAAKMNPQLASAMRKIENTLASKVYQERNRLFGKLDKEVKTKLVGKTFGKHKVTDAHFIDKYGEPTLEVDAEEVNGGGKGLKRSGRSYDDRDHWLDVR